MTGLSKFLGRGLLVLALGCSVVACGDDDDDGPAPDAGAGSGGSGGSKAGSGGSKAGSGGMAGTMSSGDITKAECIEMSKETTGNMAKASCYDCLCGMKPQETAECTADCWKLANCVAANGCAATDVNCIVAACTDDLGDSTKLAAAGTLARATPFTACAADCFEEPGDAEVDAGK